MKKGVSYVAAMVVAAALVSSCTALGPAESPTTGESAGAGNAPLVDTGAAGGKDALSTGPIQSTTVVSGTNEGQNVTSTGKPGAVTGPMASDVVSGTIPGQAGALGAAVEDSQAPVAAEWLQYENSQYGFTVDYPSVYAPREMAQLPEGASFGVGFIDRALAETETADLQPPQFSVEVYKKPATTPLQDWVRQVGWIGPATEATYEATVVGGVPAVAMQSALLMAPNRFVLVEKDGLVYRFTLLGQYADAMLASVTFVE